MLKNGENVRFFSCVLHAPFYKSSLKGSWESWFFLLDSQKDWLQILCSDYVFRSSFFFKDLSKKHKKCVSKKSIFDKSSQRMKIILMTKDVYC